MHNLSARIVLALTTLALAAQLHAKPVKVFILAGQSNMEGHAKIETAASRTSTATWCRHCSQNVTS